MQQKTYQCPMCLNNNFDQDEIRTTGAMSRFFDVQNKRFITISCSKCGYTQFFKKESGLGGNILDFFLGQ